MNDPIKKIIKTDKFNIYIWDDTGRITVSWLDKFMGFHSLEDVEEINFLTKEILKELK